jgi:hypothetical protein
VSRRVADAQWNGNMVEVKGPDRLVIKMERK